MKKFLAGLTLGAVVMVVVYTIGQDRGIEGWRE